MYQSFIINLDRQAGRMRFMAEQFENLGLSHIRISAVDGKNPSARRAALAASYAPLTHGEVGVFESHRMVWQKVIKNDLPGAYVLEDDVVISADFGLIVFPEDILDEADLIKIDAHPRPVVLGTKSIEVAPSRHIRRMIGTQNSTACYFVTARGARRLTALSREYVLPLDLFMFADTSPIFAGSRIWKLGPAAATQWKFETADKDLPPEFRDNIQSHRHQVGDPRRNIPFCSRMRLRLRNLVDWNFRSARRRRIANARSAFAASEPIVEEVIPFSTTSDAHFIAARRFVEDE